MVTSPARRTASRGLAARSQPDYQFDFCGGDLAIDFTNTVGNRGDDREDHFNTFGDVVAWAEARGVITRAAAQALRRRAAADSDEARRAHSRAVELREALYHVLAAAAAKRRPPPDDLHVLNAHVSATFEGAGLALAGAKFTLETPRPARPRRGVAAGRPRRRGSADVRPGGAHRSMRRRFVCLAVSGYDSQPHAAVVRHEVVRQSQ